MCNLYPQTRIVEVIRRLFRTAHNRATAIEAQPAIFPGRTALVIRKAEDGERELVQMSRCLHHVLYANGINSRGMGTNNRWANSRSS